MRFLIGSIFFIWFVGAATVWTEGRDIWPDPWKRAINCATWLLVAPHYVAKHMLQQEREYRDEKARRANAEGQPKPETVAPSVRLVPK